MVHSPIDPDMSVDEIMRRWPATMGVMIRRKMLCIGCPIGVFHTVADAAAAHSMEEADLGAGLIAAIMPTSVADTPSADATACGPQPHKEDGAGG